MYTVQLYITYLQYKYLYSRKVQYNLLIFKYWIENKLPSIELKYNKNHLEMYSINESSASALELKTGIGRKYGSKIRVTPRNLSLLVELSMIFKLWKILVSTKLQLMNERWMKWRDCLMGWGKIWWKREHEKTMNDDDEFGVIADWLPSGFKVKFHCSDSMNCWFCFNFCCFYWKSVHPIL